MYEAAEKLDDEQAFTPIICLLETATSNWYQELISIANNSTGHIDHWQVNALDNNCLLQLSEKTGKELLILPGEQVITAENLELLVIGTTRKIPHFNSVEFYLEKFSRSHLIILPWGVGKWLGKRGKKVNQLIAGQNNHTFALGDNSGRTPVWKYIPQFSQARKAGINILAGSDPLPVAGQHNKVASFGTIINGPLHLQGLANQLREKMLEKQAPDIRSYGKQDNLLQFLASQLLLRLRPIRQT